MNEIKVVKKQIKVVVGKDNYLLTIPSARQIKAFSERKDAETIDGVIELLDMLGLPKDVAWDIDSGSLSQIVSGLIPSEKKS